MRKKKKIEIVKKYREGNFEINYKISDKNFQREFLFTFCIRDQQVYFLSEVKTESKDLKFKK